METESSVKLLAFGTPFAGQRDACRATGEAKVRVVARKEATRLVREDTIIFQLAIEVCS